MGSYADESTWIRHRWEQRGRRHRAVDRLRMNPSLRDLVRMLAAIAVENVLGREGENGSTEGTAQNVALPEVDREAKNPTGEEGHQV
jgi:hypothetical protein